MTKLENLRDFYVLWNVKKNMKKHWINGTKWGMVKCMHEIVLKKTIFIV
jgi:predicted nucleotidyltransferase